MTVQKSSELLINLTKNTESDACFEVPVNLCGLIIGKNGSNMISINRKTQCMVQIDDVRGICKIMGPSKESIKSARHEIEEIIQECRKKFTNSNKRFVKVPVQFVGKVIGMGGKNLMEIYRQTKW